MAIERKWDYAIHSKPNIFNEFWKERLKQKRDILLITGLGWDPRMLALPNQLKSLGGNGLRNLHVISYKPSSVFGSPHSTFITKNTYELGVITKDWAEIKHIEIITRKEDNLYIGDEAISQYYVKDDLKPFTDIIVDISSLPKSLYFTLLLILVKRSIESSQIINVYVVACHDTDFDSQIVESVDDTRRLKGFKGKFARISQQKVPIIWVPILASRNSSGLARLYDEILPIDIYPILPFPCKNPRRDDDLLVEYRQALVDEWGVDPLNIIYAAEDDPLDIYRSLLNLFYQQKKTLEPLGQVSMVVSALSSKLSSIGAFMAAYEANMSIVHPIGRHEPPVDMTLDYWNNTYLTKFEDQLHSIWLTGEPYV